MKRRFDLDLTRVLCMCAVVYLHAASASFYNLDNRPLWAMSNAVNVFATLAVPLFFMMSGALLLSQSSTADPAVVLKRRVGKVLVPLLAWSAVMLFYTALTQGREAALAGLKTILNTPANTAYWFLYALVPMYLLSPALKAMTDGLDRRRWRYLLLLWLGLTLGLATARSFLPQAWQLALTEHWTLNINAVGGYLGYFLLGAYLDRLDKLPARRLLVWGTVAAAVATAAAAWVDSYARGLWSDRFTGYLTVFTALRAAGAFLLLKSLFGEKETRSRWWKLLSGSSFCVYLAHPLAIFLSIRVWFKFTGLYDPATIPQQLLFYFCVLGECVALAAALASIPGLCYVFTGQRFSSACKGSNLFALFRRSQGEKTLGKDHQPGDGT